MRCSTLLLAALPLAALTACSNDAVPPMAIPPQDVALATSRGALLAHELCGQCHGDLFNGATIGDVACPGLTGVELYTRADFSRLLVSGVAADGESVNPLMTSATALDEEDRAAVLEYLKRYFTSR